VKLVVIRHGPAGEREEWEAAGKDDRLRPLTPEGVKETKRAAAGLTTLVSRIDLFATSPLVRAVQTAELVAEEYDCSLVKLEALAPERDPDQTVQWLREQRSDQTIVIVGHEPHLSTLVSSLLAGKRQSFLELKKGGACQLEVTSPRPGGSTLEWLLTRRELSRLRQ
jgi:phosphohistidine phosphatase